jgi:hypothetical protein
VRPPPIRYPLPTLALLIVLAVVVRAGGDWVRTAMARLAPASLVETASFPSSTSPVVLFGPVPLRVLLLGGSTPVYETPGGPALEPIRHTMFAKVFDLWPRKGISTHLRVGNKTAIGWVEVGRILGWKTRLVVRSDRIPGTPAGVFPVLSWREGRVELAIWKPGRAWAEVDRLVTVDSASLPDADWQVWCSADELQLALGETVAARDEQGSRSIRASALFGRLGDSTLWEAADLASSRAFLPPQVLTIPVPSMADAAGRLAEINEKWTADATWSGVGYRGVPVADFP